MRDGSLAARYPDGSVVRLRRHANPWSFWTCAATTSPPIRLAAWSRVEIGEWAWPLLGLVVLWTSLNPRVFPPPEHDDGWASRAVFGERDWLERGSELTGHHRRGGVMLSSLFAVSALVWI